MELHAFSEYDKTSQLRASEVFDFYLWNELHTLEGGRLGLIKVIFQLVVKAK